MIKIIAELCQNHNGDFNILRKMVESVSRAGATHIKIQNIYKGKTKSANLSDWSKEYLSAEIAVKSVKNLDEAINHINTYGTMHTDAIITKNKRKANLFMKKVKSSIAIHNSSTQFADGGEFGFGGEVGISTNKLPPRGPVGLAQLVTYKYEVYGSGQIRD